MLQIETPENVAFGYQVAGIGSRFLAAFLDTLFIVGLLLAVNFALAMVITVGNLATEPERVRSWLVALFSLVSFAVAWGYYIFFELLWNGQTPGKRRFGLRVIRRNGTPVTASEVVVRNLVRLVDFLPALYALGVVVMFIDGQSRRLGDLAAGTLVVREREAIKLSSLAAAPVPPLAPGPEPPTEDSAESSLPLERLNAQDLAMVEEYFRRREDLANREALAWQIAQRLSRRMGLDQAPQQQEAERFLADVLWAQRRRSAP